MFNFLSRRITQFPRMSQRIISNEEFIFTFFESAYFNLEVVISISKTSVWFKNDCDFFGLEKCPIFFWGGGVGLQFVSKNG